MKTECLAFLVCLSLLAPAAHASDGGDILKIPVTARSMSLGGVAALSGGAEGLFYNPAGLALLRQPTLNFTHAQLFAGTRLDAIGFARPTRSLGIWGASLLSLSQDAIEGRDEQGNPTSSFGASDMVLGLSWAGGLGERSRLGVSFKHIRQKIAQDQAVGAALDLGIQARGDVFPDASFGASIQNLGPNMKFHQESFHLPLTLSVGAGYVVGRALSLQLGINHRPYAARTTLGLGTELWLGQGMSLRAGFLNALHESQAGARGGAGLLSRLGFGLGWRPMGQRFLVDYAFVPGGQDLGSTHRVTLGLEFGKRPSESGTAQPQ